jgi:DNA-directed RNA polymerase subunit E'/Rpb7
MIFPIRFKTSVQLGPTELTGDFDDVVLAKLRKNLEGVCSRHGYIRADSIEIIKRSPGKLMKQHFNGYIQFSVLCRGDVCNPAKDTVVEAKVVNKNALGLLAESYIEGDRIPVLDIIIPKKTAGIVSEIDVDDVSIGEKIYVMIIGKQYQLNDTKISIIGRIVRDPKMKQPLSPLQPQEGEDVINDGDDAYSESNLSMSDGEGHEADGGDIDDGVIEDQHAGGLRAFVDDADDEFLGGGGDEDNSDLEGSDLEETDTIEED